jgi:hypothetical protein
MQSSLRKSSQRKVLRTIIKGAVLRAVDKAVAAREQYELESAAVELEYARKCEQLISAACDPAMPEYDRAVHEAVEESRRVGLEKGLSEARLRSNALAAGTKTSEKLRESERAARDDRRASVQKLSRERLDRHQQLLNEIGLALEWTESDLPRLLTPAS